MRSLPSLPAGPAAGEEEEDKEEEEESSGRAEDALSFGGSVIASLIHQSCGRQMQEKNPNSILN